MRFNEIPDYNISESEIISIPEKKKNGFFASDRNECSIPNHRSGFENEIGAPESHSPTKNIQVLVAKHRSISGTLKVQKFPSSGDKKDQSIQEDIINRIQNASFQKRNYSPLGQSFFGSKVIEYFKFSLWMDTELALQEEKRFGRIREKRRKNTLL